MLSAALYKILQALTILRLITMDPCSEDQLDGPLSAEQLMLQLVQ